MASATSTPVTLHVLPPPPPTVSISTNPATIEVGKEFTINWSSTNARNCKETGNAAAIGIYWGGGSTVDPSGSQQWTATSSSPTTIGITCDSIDPNQPSASAEIPLAIESPTASLSVSPTAVTTGQSFTLTWSSTDAGACMASGGGANGVNWTSSLSAAGSETDTASEVGTFTYTITCTQGSALAQSQATVTVSRASSGTSGSGGGASSSGKGGGGSLEIWDVLALLAMLSMHRAARRPARYT